MSLAAPLGLLAAALVGPLVLWYVLRSRRPRRIVASTFLWRMTDRSPSAAVPWQRLRSDVTFWLVLLALLAATLAIAQPFVRVPAALGDHTILVLDVSGSMLANEDGPTRLELARRRARDLVSARAPGQEISVVEAGTRARVLLSASADGDAIERALLATRPTHGPPDLGDAFTLAASLERPGQQTVVHLLTDGEVPDADRAGAPADLLVTAVGSDRPNVGVTRLQAVPAGAGTNQVFVQVRNHHALATSVDVVLAVDGTDVVTQHVRLAPRGIEDLLLTVSGDDGAVLTARVEGAAGDSLGLDDRAHTVLSSPRDVTVLAVGETNVFLEAALGALPGTTVEHADTVPDVVTADVVVVERTATPVALSTPTLLIAPTTWPAGITTGPPTTTPTVTFQAAHDVLADVDLSGLALAEATPIQAAALAPLASGPQGTWIAAGRLDRTPVVALGFDLTQSNLPLQPAWPILVANTINWLIGPPSVVPATAGQAVSLRSADAARLRITPPGGQAIEVDAANANVALDQVGLWRTIGLDVDGTPIEGSENVLAVNADPDEGDLSRPLPDLVEAGARQDQPGEVVAAEGRRSLHRPLLAIALALLVAEAVWWWVVRPATRRRRAGVTASPIGSRQQRIALGARVVAGLLLVAALLDWRLPATTDAVDVAFVLDVSDSVGVEALAGADWIDRALQHMRDDDRASVAGVGRVARLEHSLRDDPSGGPLTIVVDGSGTDLAAGLRLGQGVVGSERRRRVVLLTDGHENQGDAVSVAAQLADTGVRVDVVSLRRGQGADVLVEEVRAPSAVREGDAFDVEVDLRNTGAAAVDVVLRLLRDGATVDERTLTLPPGRTTIDVPQQAGATGTVRYEARLSSGASSIPENDIGRAAVRVGDPASVLVVEGQAGVGEDLAAALTAGGVAAELIGAGGGLPPLDLLLAHQAVVLVNVPAAAISDTGMQALDAYVRDTGRGLVAVGGDESFGMGDYDGTTLEELLPVFARVTDPKKRPSVAEALVVDVSGSMAACHCRNDGFGGEMIEEGGINKTDITKEAVSRAVRALQSQDIVGVLAFNAAQRWVVPLQQLPDAATVDSALATLHPDGPTNVVDAIREAITGLKAAEARLRHIVLFTDGFSEDPGLVEVAGEAAAAGITLSVVATGEGTGEVLRDMADAGGGRYYPGRDLLSIPDIIVSEVQFAARPIINEGVFTPTITALDPITDELVASPPLLGYLATTDKPTARTLLRIGEESDPLLARWQAGLGTAVAWTSDASPRWSQHWVDWEGFVDFWTTTVKSTFAGPDDPSVSLEAVMTPTGMRITATTAAEVPADAELQATVTGPDGSRSRVTLTRTALNEFSAEVPASIQGVHAVSAVLTQDGTPTWRGATTAIRSWSPEYAPVDAAADILERIAAAGGGVLDPDPTGVFDPAGLDPGAASRSLWPVLALLAMILLVADIGLRRLRLERADVGRAWEALRARSRRQPAAGPEPTETTSELLRARDRARRKLEHGDELDDLPVEDDRDAPTEGT
ncbi:MAG: VWA domain-containing protein [Nitriliruptorales bacterium]|nr:VWA domain-containing protein [Nitriliruptorales bacterium]